MTRTRIAALAITALALAGCGSAAAASGTNAPPPATSAPAAPQQASNEPGGFGTSPAIANPVPILKMTGCPVPASERNGNIGMDSDRGADCTFPGTFGESVWVFTYPSVAYRDNRLAHPLDPPSDGFYTIRGPGASIITVERTQGFTGPSPQESRPRRGHRRIPALNGA